MHPDSVIAALRRELDELPADATARRAAIEAEIAHTDTLPRPTVKPDGGATTSNPTRVYYDALRQELATAAEDRRSEIQEEIDMVERDLQEGGAVNGETPSDAEVEQRKRVRTGRKGSVEQARNVPVPNETAPVEGAKE